MATTLTLVHGQGDKSDHRGILNAGTGTTDISGSATSVVHTFNTTGDYDTTPVIASHPALDPTGHNATSVVQCDTDWDQADKDSFDVRVKLDSAPGSGNTAKVHIGVFAWEDETK